jgi:hypothetical protein
VAARREHVIGNVQRNVARRELLLRQPDCIQRQRLSDEVPCGFDYIAAPDDPTCHNSTRNHPCTSNKRARRTANHPTTTIHNRAYRRQRTFGAASCNSTSRYGATCNSTNRNSTGARIRERSDSRTDSHRRNGSSAK